MGKLAAFVAIVFVGALVWFAMTNTVQTTVQVPFYQEFQDTLGWIILYAAGFGALGMLAVFFIRDTRRFIATYQFQRKQKKSVKLQDLYGGALNAILANDEIEARRALEEILKEEPAHTDALLRLGDIAAAKDDRSEALGFYKRAHSSSPRNIEVLFSLARELEAAEIYSEAHGHIDAVLEIDPDNLRALYSKRALLERDHKWDDLIEAQKTILRHNHPEEAKAREQANLLGYRYELARHELEKGMLDKANKEFRSILRAEPNFVPACLGLAETMIGEGETEDAVRFLETTYEKTSSLIVLARLEDLLVNIGDPAGLILIYKRAISANPEDDMLPFFLGKLYYRLEMVDDALETLSAIEPVKPQPELHQLLGALHMKRQQCEQAVREFRKSIDIKKAFRLPYCCRNCGNVSDDWSGRCDSCGVWNTYRFNLNDACK